MLVTFIFMWIFIIITILLLIYAISLEYKYVQMVIYPIPKCFNDWLCMMNINGEIVEVNMTKNTLFNNNSSQNVCLPLTVENICNFTYIDQNGNTITEKPGTYVNTWADISTCNSNDNYAGCPFYTVGDIYWRSCYNGINGNKYNNITRTYFNENQNLSLCN